MLGEVKTLGAAVKVKSKYLALGAGAGQAVLAAVALVKYRIVGVQASGSANTIFKLFHTASATADNVIAAGDLLAHTPMVVPSGDYGDQIGAAGGVVTCDNSAGTLQLVVFYQEFE